MIFLISYDRERGKLMSIRTFDDDDWEGAQNERLRVELSDYHGRVKREVVLLQAGGEEVLRQTHRRYFEDLAELARTSARAA